MKKAMDTIGYKELRAEQAEKRKPSSAAKPARSWASASASSPRSLAQARPRIATSSASPCSTVREIRIHPTGSIIARMGTKSQGQGHETTWAQIIATELGIPADDIMIEEGNTDTAPYGLGTYGSRSTPVAGAAIAMAARKIKARRR
jgi:carbon-monoxide dehydrogenase large subunit